MAVHILIVWIWMNIICLKVLNFAFMIIIHQNCVILKRDESSTPYMRQMQNSCVRIKGVNSNMHCPLILLVLGTVADTKKHATLMWCDLVTLLIFKLWLPKLTQKIALSKIQNLVTPTINFVFFTWISII